MRGPTERCGSTVLDLVCGAMQFLIFLLLMVVSLGVLALCRIDYELGRIAKALEARNDRDKA